MQRKKQYALYALENGKLKKLGEWVRSSTLSNKLGLYAQVDPQDLYVKEWGEWYTVTMYNKKADDGHVIAWGWNKEYLGHSPEQGEHK